MEHTNISQNNQNYPSTWKMFKVCQKIKSIFKKWWSIRWYHEVLRNAKCILLYIKMPKQPTWSDTAQYHPEAIKSFPVTEKYEKPLIKVLKTWKNNEKNNLRKIKKWDLRFNYVSRYQNTLSKVRHLHISPKTWKTLWYYSNSPNLVNIKGLWKKLIESEKY